MCGISMKDRRKSEELREMVWVEPMATAIRSGRLIWYEYVMRKCMEFKKDMVRKCRSGYGST